MTVENQTARQMEKPTESKRAADIVFYDESLLVRQEKSFEREREQRVFAQTHALRCLRHRNTTAQLLGTKRNSSFFELSPRSPTPKGAVECAIAFDVI